MRPPGSPLRLLLMLCLLAGGFSPAGAHAASNFERSMASVEKLYGDFKYEQALKQLNQARSVTRGVEDDATIYLYEGVILFELSKDEQARSKFLAALLLKPEAQLPLSVSPKIEAELEAQRARAVEKLSRQLPEKSSAPTRISDARKPPETPSSAPSATASGNPGPSIHPNGPVAPSLVPSSPALHQHATGREIQPVPFILMGVGVAAAGVGVGFGLSSQAQVASARTASFQSDVISHQQAAQRSALTANVLFGTAGLAAVGALVSWWLLPPHAGPAAPESP